MDQAINIQTKDTWKNKTRNLEKDFKKSLVIRQDIYFTNGVVSQFIDRI